MVILMTKKRNYNLDLIKSIAIFFVIFAHYFLNTGFYTIEYTNKITTVSFVLKSLSITCVPLFLIVTGYLMNQKEPSKKYYLNLIITLLKYILISVICLIVRKFILHDHTTIKHLIIGIFTFETNPYSWYIGLYILIPSLNIIIKNIKCLFLLLNSFQIKERTKALEVISKHTLSIYLFSFVIDTIIYKNFNQHFITYEERFFNIYIVVLIFTLSLIFALCIDTAIYFCMRKLERI